MALPANAINILFIMAGIASGFFAGIFFSPTTRMVSNSSSSSSTSSTHHLRNSVSKNSGLANPRGAERLPPGVDQSDSSPHRICGHWREDPNAVKPKYLVAFVMDYTQRDNIDAAAKSLSENFTMLMFHSEGRLSEWDEFEWSKRAIHMSFRHKSKRWFLKNYLHPDIGAGFEYIIFWGDDLVAERFDAEEYLNMMRKNGVRISLPGLQKNEEQIISKRDTEFDHRKTEDEPGYCKNLNMSSSCSIITGTASTILSMDLWCCCYYHI